MLSSVGTQQTVHTRWKHTRAWATNALSSCQGHKYTGSSFKFLGNTMLTTNPRLYSLLRASSWHKACLQPFTVTVPIVLPVCGQTNNQCNNNIDAQAPLNNHKSKDYYIFQMKKNSSNGQSIHFQLFFLCHGQFSSQSLVHAKPKKMFLLS